MRQVAFTRIPRPSYTLRACHHELGQDDHCTTKIMNAMTAEPSDAYQDALHFLYDRINYEKSTDQPYTRNDFRLSRMERLLVELDHPQQAAPVIHIAGSKGKGSVAWLLAESLRLSGKRVGLYTSPHIARLEERFVVDGRPIQPQDLIEAVEAVRPAACRIEKTGHGHATFFELTTAIAWWVFRHRPTDVNVIEVGLGGRLDSTNVCWPALGIITSISYDHQAQLGETLAEIAYEKAGIIKPGVPVVSGATNQEASTVIQRIAQERGSMLRELGRDFNVIIAKQNRAGINQPQHFSYRPNTDRWPTGMARIDQPLRLLGQHQAANAGLVLASADILRDHGWELPEEALREAMQSTQVPGRIQVVGLEPLIILDTAHNEASIEALIETLDNHFPPIKRTMIFSASRDKKWMKILHRLLLACDRLVLTQFLKNPRAVPVDDLLATAQDLRNQLGLNEKVVVETAPHPREALELAKKTSSPSDMIVVCGSFFLAGEIVDAMNLPSPHKPLQGAAKSEP